MGLTVIFGDQRLSKRVACAASLLSRLCAQARNRLGQLPAGVFVEKSKARKDKGRQGCPVAAV